MDSKLMESYLDIIAEQVMDENKIVTYKSLSRSLKIHVNTAKQLLYAYLTKEKSANSFPVSATYLVAGKVVDGGFNITVVNEDNLKKCYANFVEITSKHVYSVQKGKSLKDLKILYETEKESSNLKSYSLVIKCYKGEMKFKHEVKKKPESNEKQSIKIIRHALLPEKQVGEVESNKKPDSFTNKNAIESPKKSSPKKNSETVQVNVKKPAGNIADLFAKAPQKNADKSLNNVKSSKNVQIKSREGNSAVVGKVNIDSYKSEPGTSEKIYKLKDSLKKENKGNKRKRIQTLSDSDENSSNDEEEKTMNVVSKDSLLPLENPEGEEKEEAKVVSQNKKKKRKVIDRTVMNEEGYLETKKEIVFETDSENDFELELVKKDSETKSDKGKRVQGSGTAKKQTSLLTFFRKS